MDTGSLIGLSIMGGGMLLVWAMKANLKRLRRKRRELEGGSPYRESGLQPKGDTKGVWSDDEFVVEAAGAEMNFACGHSGPKRFTLTLLGKDATPTKKFFKDRPFCPACLKTKIIRCVLCGVPIFPGEPVAAYGDMRRFKKAWKTYADAKRRNVIGCMGWNCCPSGGFFAGHWTGEGIHSPFATGSAAGDAFASPGQMIVTNIGPEGTTVDRVDIDPVDTEHTD